MLLQITLTSILINNNFVHRYLQSIVIREIIGNRVQLNYDPSYQSINRSSPCKFAVIDVSLVCESSSRERSTGYKPASSYQFRRIAHNGEIKRARGEMERRRNGGGIELADLSSLRSSTYLRLSSLPCTCIVARGAGIHACA